MTTQVYNFGSAENSIFYDNESIIIKNENIDVIKINSSSVNSG